MGLKYPPPSSTNKTMTGMLIDEMTDLLTDNIPKIPKTNNTRRL